MLNSSAVCWYGARCLDSFDADLFLQLSMAMRELTVLLSEHPIGEELWALALALLAFWEEKNASAEKTLVVFVDLFRSIPFFVEDS